MIEGLKEPREAVPMVCQDICKQCKDYERAVIFICLHCLKHNGLNEHTSSTESDCEKCRFGAETDTNDWRDFAAYEAIDNSNDPAITYCRDYIKSGQVKGIPEYCHFYLEQVLCSVECLMSNKKRTGDSTTSTGDK